MANLDHILFCFQLCLISCYILGSTVGTIYNYNRKLIQCFFGTFLEKKNTPALWYIWEISKRYVLDRCPFMTCKKTLIDFWKRFQWSIGTFGMPCRSQSCFKGVAKFAHVSLISSSSDEVSILTRAYLNNQKSFAMLQKNDAFIYVSPFELWSLVW